MRHAYRSSAASRVPVNSPGLGPQNTPFRSLCIVIVAPATTRVGDSKGGWGSPREGGRLQGRVGRLQGRVGRLQGRVGESKGGWGAPREGGEAPREGGGLQGRVGRLQGRVGRLQGRVGRLQGRVGGSKGGWGAPREGGGLPSLPRNSVLDPKRAVPSPSSSFRTSHKTTMCGKADHRAMQHPHRLPLSSKRPLCNACRLSPGGSSHSACAMRHNPPPLSFPLE